MILNRGELEGRRYLSEAAVALMTRKQTREPVRAEYGFGWSTTGGVFGHGGAFKTNMRVDPRLGLVTVFMIQQAGWCNKEEGEKVQSAFTKEAVKAMIASAPARPLPYLNGAVLVRDQFSTAAASLDNQHPATGWGAWKVGANGNSGILLDGTLAAIQTNGGTPGRGTAVASLPFELKADAVYALMVSYHFSQPVKTDSWAGLGFCDAKGRKGPWMLVRPPKSEVADGQAVGFTGDPRKACSGTVYAPWYPHITAAVVWDTRSREIRYYLNNMLEGSVALVSDPTVDHIFFQGYQTGSTVTVKKVLLTVQPAR